MPYDLSSEFFEKILRKFENNENLRVEHVDVTQACEVGENFVSDVKRVKIRGRISPNEAFSKSVVVKLMSENEAYVRAFKLDIPFLNEIFAYKRIIPELKKYSKENLSLPDCIYADKDILVLEDFSTEGYKNVDKLKGFTANQTHNILREFARLHATSLVLKQHHGEIIEKLSEGLVDPLFDESVREGPLLDGQSNGIALGVKVFQELPQNEYNKSIIVKLEMLKELFKPAQIEVVCKKRKFNVVNHGDTWGNNILVNSNDEIKLIDVQLMRYSSVAADLCYFFYINFSPQERRQHLDANLKFYLRNLNTLIKEQGFNLENDLTIDWLNNEMKEFAIFGCMSALWLLPIFYFRKDDLNMEEFNIDEYNNVEEQWKKCSNDFKVRIKEVICDFFDHNDINFYKN